MKKIIFTILLTIIFVGNVEAFTIDINKIDINSKSDELIKNLDSSYKIETRNFDNKIIYDENAINFAKKIVKSSFEDKTLSEKQKEFLSYLYFSDDNGFETLTGNLFVTMYLEKLEEYDVEYDYIKDIKSVVFNKNDVLTFVYLPDAMVNKEKKDIVLSYWLKKSGRDYKLYYPWLTIDEDLENYFMEKTKEENNGVEIGGTYNQLSLLGDGNVVVDDSTLSNIYNSNKYSSVQISGMSDSGTNIYASGFYLREGIVVTTWSVFSQLLNDSNFIFVNDISGNTYEVLGIVAAQADYDVVALKINEETGQRVTLGNTDSLKMGDKVFTINSKSNSTFSINYGDNISYNDGRLQNMYVLSESDVGSAIYNTKGEVIGFNVADQLYSELSYANSTDYLKELQNTLINTNYNDIKYTVIETFKQSYYMNFQEEVKYNNIPNRVWKKTLKIGKLSENVPLELIKGSYENGIVSLRYKNQAGNMIDSLYLVSGYTEELTKEGYKLTYQDDQKTIYSNNKNKVIIKNSLNYLIIIIMEA